MTKPRIEAPCFLCDEQATYVEIDTGNRRFYDCLSPFCGAYEISTRVMRDQALSEDFKYFIREKAREGRKTGHYLDIDRKGPDTDELKLRYKPLA